MKSAQQLFESNVEALCADRSSGSRIILIRFVDHALSYLESDGESADIRNRVLTGAMSRLRLAFPVFAVIAHFEEGLMVARQEHQTNTYITRYAEQWTHVNTKVAVAAAGRLALLGKRILFHSRSGALAALGEALTESAGVTIVQTESNPGAEGIEQARQLARLGLAVTLIPDMAIGREVEHCDMAIVGSDWVGGSQFINKLGTRAIAGLCLLWKKPFYVLCDSRKLRADVPPVVPELFEAVEMSWTSGIITEMS
jgi:translation initiation factor 2B subunit (eIF-2B alpha/beta/delta family)